MTARLPKPGGDDGSWGDILNDFLNQSHNADGSIKDSVVTPAALAGNIPQTKITNLQTDIASKLNIDQTTPQTIINGQPIQDSLTASQLVSTDVNKKLQTLAVETYPSLTELSYVKGLTSGAQAQMADIVTVPLNLKTDGTDNLSAIQSALDKTGHILIKNVGTYMINGTLMIGSNTKLELGEGVVIKQKTLGQNLLKNTDTVNGNENISIIGGAWDYNFRAVTNTVDPHQTHAIVLQNIKNLNLFNVKIIDAQKYAWLVADVTYLSVYGLDFDTTSDGLHLMGPINYADIRNLKGTTGDNLLAFTIGDYNTYELCRGNMTNITVSGIYCDNSAEPIRLVGNPNYYFDNIVIENISGNVLGGRVVALIQDTDLTYTDIRNIVFRNIHCATDGTEQIQINCMRADNIVIENISSGGFVVIKIPTAGNVKNLSIRNVSTNYNGPCMLIEGTVDKLSIDGIDARYVTGNTSVFIELLATAIVNDLFMCNIKMTYGSNFLFIAGALTRAVIENYDLTNVTAIVVNTGGGTKTLYFKNGYAQYVSRFISNQSGATASLLRVYADGCLFASDANSRVIADATAKIGITGATFRAKDITSLTPTAGDILYNTEPTFGTGVGLYIYDTAWRKL